MRILLVEDEESILRVLAMILELEHHQIDTAKNGAEALKHLNEKPLPEVILLDLMMPIMDGWEFLRHKAADPRLAAIPTIVLSAYSNHANMSGVLGFFDKPLDMPALLKRLAECRTA